MSRILIIVLLGGLWLSGTSGIAQKKDWQLAKKEDGILIYTRPNQEGLPVKELRIVTEVKSSLSAIVSLLSDKAAYPQWVYGCAESTFLENISETESYHYQITSMPWPIQNRDIIIHSRVVQDPETKVVSLIARGQPDYIPVKGEYVRVRSYRADWKFVPKENGIIEMEFIVSVDPAGSIPNWLINMAVAEGPKKSIKGLKEVLPNYQGVVLKHIKN
jgi:hypothetical protein